MYTAQYQISRWVWGDHSENVGCSKAITVGISFTNKFYPTHQLEQKKSNSFTKQKLLSWSPIKPEHLHSPAEEDFLQDYIKHLKFESEV